MPRFVILEHRTPAGYVRGDHWDLMFEADGVLRTWAVESEPQPGASIDAEALADHRLEYLTIEGPLSGGRGSVTRWDAGTYETVESSESAWRMRLGGEKLQGEVLLERVEAQRWRVSFAGGEATRG